MTPPVQKLKPSLRRVDFPASIQTPPKKKTSCFINDCWQESKVHFGLLMNYDSSNDLFIQKALFLRTEPSVFLNIDSRSQTFFLSGYEEKCGTKLLSHYELQPNRISFEPLRLQIVASGLFFSPSFLNSNPLMWLLYWALWTPSPHIWRIVPHSFKAKAHLHTDMGAPSVQTPHHSWLKNTKWEH